MRALNMVFGLPTAFIYGWILHVVASRAAGDWFAVGLFVLSVAAAFFFEWLRSGGRPRATRNQHRAPVAF